MRRPLVIPLLLGVLVLAGNTPSVLATSTLSSPSAEPNEAMAESGNFLVEKGVVARGETFHAILSGTRPARLVSDRLSYTFTSSRDDAGRPPDVTIRSLLEQQHAVNASLRAKGVASANTIVAPDDPNPPIGGGRPGEVQQTIAYCVSVLFGGQNRTSDVTYVYRYGYTLDMNGDGQYDAQLGWKLEEVRVRQLQHQDAQRCD